MSEISFREQICPGSNLLFEFTGEPHSLSALYAPCPLCKMNIRANPEKGNLWALEPHYLWEPVTDPTIIEMVCDADYCAGAGHQIDLRTGEGPLRGHFVVRP